MSGATLRNRVVIGRFLSWSNVSLSVQGRSNFRSKTGAFLKCNNQLSSCTRTDHIRFLSTSTWRGAVLGKCDKIGSSQQCQSDNGQFSNCDCKQWTNGDPKDTAPVVRGSLRGKGPLPLTKGSNITQQPRRYLSVGRSSAVNNFGGGSSGRRRTNLSKFFGGGIMTTQPLTVCVEGNIGSGKTTFLKHFKSNPEVCVFDEPISKWRDCQGYNLLDLMYKDPRKWSLCFQSYVQLTMLDLHTKPVVQPIKMMERSIYSAHYCFVKNLRDEGLMDEAQYAVLSEWFNFSTANLPIKLDLIVYLRTDPEVAHQRIAERGRSEENAIKLEYLQSVHELHENWLVRNQKSLPCPVLTIDANLELEDMAPNYLLCEERLFQKPAVANC